MPVYNHLVPTVLEQTSRGERSFDLYSRLLANRIVLRPEVAFSQV